jgi:hypothetical protein
MRSLLLFVLGLLSSSISFAQTVRYVSAAGTNTNPVTATSWANATPDLQGAINASQPGEQVWVRSGLYRPTTTTGPDSRTISFTLKEGVAIYGGFVGSETALSQRPAVSPNTSDPSSTTLSGDIGTAGDDSDNSYHVVRNPAGLTNAAVLDGFVITAGNANGTDNDSRGGGMDNGPVYTLPQSTTCSPTIQNCLFYRNQAIKGGAIVVAGDNLNYSVRITPLFKNCRFLENSAQTGGVIYTCNFTFESVGATLTNCTFEQNTAVEGGVVTNVTGGSYTSGISILNSIFRRNTATNGGAVVCKAGKSQAYFGCYNSIFEENTAEKGGVFYSVGSTFGSMSGYFYNCSFQRNNASQLGGVAYLHNGVSVRITNSILWHNGGASTLVAISGFAGIEMRYSLFEPTVTNFYEPIGNITAIVSPFITDSSFQLSTCSPAINAADVNAYTSANGTTTDLAGKPRFRNPGPPPSQLDMGAYQADLSGTNGMVSVQSGNWNDAGTWSCGNRLPLVGENAGIRHIVTLPASYVGTSAQLSYGPGGQLLFGEGAQVK